MGNQAEKNKEILLTEIEKYSEKPISPATAKYLADCRGAYKAICKVEKHHNRDSGTADGDLAHRDEKLSQGQIKRWMDCLENEDGTTGAHYTKEQVDQYRRGLSIDCDPMELYAASNMMYSDYCKVLKKYGMDRPEVYVELAAAFLRDKDAGAKDKLAAYHEYIVEGE